MFKQLYYKYFRQEIINPLTNFPVVCSVCGGTKMCVLTEGGYITAMVCKKGCKFSFFIKKDEHIKRKKLVNHQLVDME